MDFFKRKKPEKKEISTKTPIGVLTHIVPISNSGRKNHYAIYEAGRIYGDTSGSIDISPLAACDYLDSQEMAAVEYRDPKTDTVVGKGLNRERILSDHKKFEASIKQVLEEKVVKLAELQKSRASPGDLRNISKEYDEKVKQMRQDYEAAQNKYTVRINIGLMTAVCVRAEMLKAAEPYYSFGKTSLERITQAGWELRRKPVGKKKGEDS